MKVSGKDIMLPDKLILLFARSPEKGRIKTRLAAGIGEETALALYKLFVADILKTLQRAEIPFRIFFSPPDSAAVMENWLGKNLQYRAQAGEDLGEKMENAFLQSFKENIEKVLIIGSDMPDLTNALICEAFSSLECNDAVVGPALDGGYYLIGFRKDGFLPLIFRDIPWGTGHVFRETMKVLHTVGRRVHLLPERRDIDTILDLESLYRRSEFSHFRDSQTMSYMVDNRDRLFHLQGNGG